MKPSVSLGLLLGLIGVTLFGGTVPATRYAVQWLDPAFLTFGRATIAGILAGALLLIRGATPPWRRGIPFTDILIVAACLIFGFPLLMAYGSLTVPSSHAGVVLGILPLATTLAAIVLAGERPSLSFFAISCVGCALVVAFALRNGGAGEFGLGDAYLGLSAVICAVGYAVSGKLSRSMPGWEVIAWALVVALVVTAPAALWMAPRDLAAIPLSAWGAMAYVACISQFFAFFFWNAGLAMGGIARVGQLQLLQTFLIVVLSWPINGEAPDPETYLFMLAVMVVVAIGQRAKVKAAPAE